MGAFSAADEHVGGFVKGVAGYGYDIEVWGVGREPVFFDYAAVCDDGDGLEMELFFAVSVSLWLVRNIRVGVEADLWVGVVERTYLTNSPRNLGYRNGSPPAKLIFFMPASARSLIPRLASSSGRM